MDATTQDPCATVAEVEIYTDGLGCVLRLSDWSKADELVGSGFLVRFDYPDSHLCVYDLAPSFRRHIGGARTPGEAIRAQ